jgi:hypothetical protein
VEKNHYQISEKDALILKRLGEKLAKIGSLPQMEEKRTLWKKLNALNAERPMILVETSGVLDETIPISSLECEGEWAKEIERNLKDKIYHFEFIQDDMVIEPRVTYGYKIDSTNYGLEAVKHLGKSKNGIGSYSWEPPITDIEEGLKKLHFRSHEINLEETELNKSLLEKVFEGILPVEHRGWYWWTQGLTIDLIDLIGLEGFMYAMYDQPDKLHEIMGFLRDDHLNTIDWFERNGLLFPNNQDDYIGSGGCGYTDLLPKKSYTAGETFGVESMWGLSESQETVGVSTEMFAEFVFPYQLPIISKFGLACYGCCEPLDKRWHIIKNIPNLRRVSVSPWADQKLMAENLGKNYIYSRKPNPAHISTSEWDEALLKEELKKTLSLTSGINLELVMKDVHTVSNEPWRLKRWVELARNAI